MWTQGPGLTIQRGPFKTRQTDYPKLNKVPWKGGGVAGGGSLHSGHGNWFSQMTPMAIKAAPYTLKPSQYALLVGPAEPSTVYKKGSVRGRITGPVAGQPILTSGVQMAGQGFRQVQEEGREQEPTKSEEQQNEQDEGYTDNYLLQHEASDAVYEPTLPGQFPQQTQYVSTQQVVEPLLSQDRMEVDEPIPQADEPIQIHNQHISYGVSQPVSTHQATLPSPVIYEAPPVHPHSVITMEIQDHINTLTDEINKLRTENQAMGLNASFAYTNAVNETDSVRRQAIERITEYEAEISRLNAALESAGTRNEATVYNPIQELILQNLQYVGPEVTGRRVERINTEGMRPRFDMGMVRGIPREPYVASSVTGKRKSKARENADRKKLSKVDKRRPAPPGIRTTNLPARGGLPSDNRPSRRDTHKLGLHFNESSI